MDNLILFTMSPKGSTRADQVNSQIRMYCNKIFVDLLSFATSFEINPELNLNGNVHFHGYIAYSNERKGDYLKFIMKLKAYGYTKVNRVKHSLSRAIEYHHKDRTLLNGIIDSKFLPINQDSIYLKKAYQTTIPEYFDQKNISDETDSETEKEDDLEYGISQYLLNKKM